MDSKNGKRQSGAAENLPATDSHQKPESNSAESSAYELLARSLSAEEARKVRRILTEWSHGDENSYPFQHALLTRAHWQVAATTLLEVAKIAESLRVAAASSVERIAQFDPVRIADLERVRALAQVLANHVGVMREQSQAAAAHLTTAAPRYDQAAKNFLTAQATYLDAHKASEWLSFCVTLAFVAVLGIGVGFLTCYCWPAAH